MKVVAFEESHAAAWASLFEASGSACFCHWWHFEGTKNDWLGRAVAEPHRNRDEQLALARSGAPATGGLLALEAGLAVGWMKLAPRAALPKLLRQGPYRSLALGASAGVWSIGCLLVLPARRHTGVARTLVRAADDYVREWDGIAIEAYPRRADRELHPEEAWMGTADLFASCGFVEVAGEGPYPVMRKDIPSRAA